MVGQRGRDDQETAGHTREDRWYVWPFYLRVSRDITQAFFTDSLGPAKLLIKRGIYRQLFCRLSTTSIEKCNPESLRLTNEYSIEIIVESTQPPASAVVAPSTSSALVAPSPTIPSPDKPVKSPVERPPSSSSKRPPPEQSSPNENNAEASSSKRMKTSIMVSEVPADSPDNTMKTRRTSNAQSNTSTKAAHPRPSSSTTPMASTLTMALNNPTVFNPLRLHEVPFVPPSSANRAAKQQLANSTIIPWLRSQIQLEEGYEAFAKSKGKILSVTEALRCYRFAKRAIDTWNGVEAPDDLSGCAGRKITKVSQRADANEQVTDLIGCPSAEYLASTRSKNKLGCRR